ncbi:hypothetical protein HYW42_03995 [Candidatus Daviesbacteria bacterium]|nr:hypothetical protein [Candidatus Daviesbacteria bacterium]
MPALKGIFEQFEDIENLSVTDLSHWLNPIQQITNIENHIANRILYPQTLPVNKDDFKIDLAILREALKRVGMANKANRFIDKQSHKILIPTDFIKFIPNLNQLVWAFVDGLFSELNKSDGSNDLWLIVLSGDSNEIVGTLLIPNFQGGGDLLELGVQGKIFKIKAGSLSVIPCFSDSCRVVFKVNKGLLLGSQESAIDLRGGKLGIMIDGRIK